MAFDLVLAVSKTVYPDGTPDKYHNGKMLRVTHIAGQSVKWLHRIEPIQNTVKPGGVCKGWFAEKVIEGLGL